MDTSAVWSIFNDEDTIQGCVEEAFSKKGYDVTNYHKADKRHENGVDIVCESPEERINIQVKVKPRGKDIDQLKKLSETKADKKIYIYVSDPVVNFDNKKSNYKDVEFWNDKKLHDFLIENGSTVYLRLLFLSSGMLRNIVSSLETITLCQDVQSSQLKDNVQSLEWINLKDRAVKLHASLELVYEWYKSKFLKKDKVDKKEVETYLDEIFTFFDLIDKNSTRDLYFVLNGLKKRYPNLLSKYVEVTSHASNWIGMPYHVNDDDIVERIRNWVLPKERQSNSFYRLTNFYLNRLREIAEAIEDGVDWVFQNKTRH